MTQIWHRIKTEPAVASGIPTVVAAAAAGIWEEPWLAFLAAAFAGIGALFTRSNVTPLEKQ